MSDEKNDEVFTEREVVSIHEIVENTSLDYEAVSDVLYGGSYYMGDQEEIEEFLGLDMTEVRMFFGPRDE